MTVSQIAAWAGVSLFAATMVVAGLMDVLTMTIRNRLVLLIIAGYAVLAPIAGIPLPAMAASAGAAAAVLAVGLGLFAMGWVGGGDAKLATATVLWLGTAQVVPYLLYTAVLGGVLTLVVLAFRRMSLPPAWRSVEWLERLHAPQAGVPYGAAMAPAALLAFAHTPWMTVLL